MRVLAVSNGLSIISTVTTSIVMSGMLLLISLITFILSLWALNKFYPNCDYLKPSSGNDDDGYSI